MSSSQVLDTAARRLLAALRSNNVVAAKECIEAGVDVEHLYGVS